MKSRLFASAAFPLLSLSLVLPPAHVFAAASSVEEVGATNRVAAGSYDVAQDATSEEELLKKRQQQEQEQQQAPAEAPQAAEPPAEAPPAPKQEAPAEAPPPPAAEPAPQAEAPAEKPRKREPAAEQPAAEQPAAEQPAAEQPAQQEAPAEKPRRQKQPAAEQQQEQVAPGAEQPAEQPRRKKREQQQQDQAAPQAEQPQAEQAQPQSEPEQAKPPRKNGKPAAADGGEQPEKPRKKPAAEAPQAEPAQKPAAETAPAGEQPAPDNAAKPQETPATGKAPVPAGQPAEAQPQANPGEAPAQQQGEQVVPTQPDGTPVEQPAGQAGQPPAGQPPVAQTEQPIPAPEKVTPQELERRKEIAADPSKSTETVVLPVQNGAAVLDSDKDADRSGGVQSRRDRDRQRGQEQQVRVPKSDADAQMAPGGAQPAPLKIEAITSEQGRRLDRRPQFARPDGANFGQRGDDNRVIIQFNNQTYVRGDDDRRFLRDGERPIYEQLPRDRYRETIDRDGYQIVTVRNRYGDIIQRSRLDNRGREQVLYYTPELYDNPDRDYFDDPGAELPPMRLRIPLQDYIMDTSSDEGRDYYDFLREPPVEPVERVYSLNEVKYSARIRDKVRRIDLDTVTFATGSAEIPMSQARSLRKVADAINEVLKKDPTETFLVEGHTDAVGSDQSNLILSDQRAESVANVMTDVYGIPPENLATQGYGERYLKVNTQSAEQQNRRVTIRRVTALVRPVASNN
ncbi:outer membrane protein OmpA-like peptidoglycan-associated protein [Rhizobium metallidurans]|uniref:Outer membrane protein OmpA-like peptidoglycan-associated protein n=2 Tax=Rhizobium metallidurans TaxID=1265931 RepID=A0A7W6G9S1_9HYPH|nr:outer membrane protein OmpA-like peptidoglycan-associated protein [Rhizobium metallidurans]